MGIGPQEEAADAALRHLETITTSSTARGKAATCLLAAAKTAVMALTQVFKYDYGERVLEKETHQSIVRMLDYSRLYAKGLDRSELNSSLNGELVSAIRGLNIDHEVYADALFIEPWALAAYKMYVKSDGFAGMTLRKYISRMRPNAPEPVVKKKRVFSTQRIAGEDTVDDEVLHNVKRKVREKAPRLKPRMGRI